MNNTSERLWQGFSASVPGSGHIRREIPCQDASGVILSPRAALIVCDGRGSAKLSHFGAQKAVKAFRTQCAVMEPFLVNILDSEKGDSEQWQKFCQIMYRTLAQAKIELSEEHGEPEKEFDFTVAFAIAGSCHIGAFQVGDGAIVLRQEGSCRTAFAPEKGEFANQTNFLRPGGEVKLQFQAGLFPAALNSGIAVTSDGPEHVMFKLPEMAPGKIFDVMLDDMRSGNFCRQDILDFLTDKRWHNDPRGTDDRSLAVLAPCLEEEKEEEPCSEEPAVPESAAEMTEAEVPEKEETASDVPAKAAHSACVSGRKALGSCKKKVLKALQVSAIAAMLCVGAGIVKVTVDDCKGKMLLLKEENSRIRNELFWLRKELRSLQLKFEKKSFHLNFNSPKK